MHYPRGGRPASGIEKASSAHYREAIDRFGRTRLRPEQARAHLLSGELLRRQNRRMDARQQLCSAHDIFNDTGRLAFAERARHELLATGETVRERKDETRNELTPQEEQIHASCLGGTHQPRNRRPGCISASHGRMAFAKGVHEARHHLTQRAARRVICTNRGRQTELRSSNPERGTTGRSVASVQTVAAAVTASGRAEAQDVARLSGPGVAGTTSTRMCRVPIRRLRCTTAGVR